MGTDCRGAAALLGPLWEGAVGAADWGREKRVASLPPSALRADTSLAEGGFGSRILTPVTAGRCGHRPLRNGKGYVHTGGQSRPPLYSAKRDGCRRLFLFSYTAAPRR